MYFLLCCQLPHFMPPHPASNQMNIVINVGLKKVLYCFVISFDFNLDNKTKKKQRISFKSLVGSEKSRLSLML